MIRKDAAAIIALIDRGMDVNTVGRNGDSLLIQAIRQDMPELVDKLMGRRARLNARNRSGETALSIAAFGGKLAYVQRFQWPVFPVHSVVDGHCTCGKPACKRPGKHPVAALAPRGLLDATLDPDIINRWWTEFPNANIGLPTGAGSGLVVLDVDTLKGGDDGLSDLLQVHGPLPETVMAITGSGGYHYLFAHPGADIKIGNARVQVAQVQESDVRAFARAHGMPVGTRGRISAEVQAAFEAHKAAERKAAREARAARKAARETVAVREV